MFSPPEEESEEESGRRRKVACFPWKEKPKWAKSGGRRSVEAKEEEEGSNARGIGRAGRTSGGGTLLARKELFLH